MNRNQMTNDGTEAGAFAVVDWAEPFAHGRVFCARKKSTEEWTVFIELMEIPGALAVDPGATVEDCGDGLFRIIPASTTGSDQ